MSEPIKRLRIKVFRPGNKTYRTMGVSAGNGRAFVRGGELNALSRIADELEKAAPMDIFDMKQVGENEYNFVHRGRKEIADADMLVGGLHLGEVTTVRLGETHA